MTKTRCPSGWANAASLLLSPRPKLPTHSAPGALNATTNPSPPRWPHCRGQGMAGAPYGGKPGRTLNGVLNLMSPPNGSRLSCGASAGGRKRPALRYESAGAQTSASFECRPRQLQAHVRQRPPLRTVAEPKEEDIDQG